MKKAKLWIVSVIVPVCLFMSSFSSKSDDFLCSPAEYFSVMKAILPSLSTIGIICKKDDSSAQQMLPDIKAASTSQNLQLVIAEILEMKDVTAQFKFLVNENKVQVLWVIGNDPVLSSPVGSEFIIKNSVLNKVLVVAPTNNWVMAGAFLSMYKDGDKIRLTVNKKTASVMNVQIPPKYKPDTYFY